MMSSAIFRAVTALERLESPRDWHHINVIDKALSAMSRGEWLGRPEGKGYNAPMRDNLSFRAAPAARLEFIVKES